jgi:hypothetical protein
MPISKTMQAVRVRRTGNSNAISLPSDFEELGYVKGAVVIVIALPSGELRVIPQERMGQILQGAHGGEKTRGNLGRGAATMPAIR